MKKVGIIGGSGFIGSYITKTFLENGFEVKVSTTDITREDKYQHLMLLKHSDNLQISEMNVEDKASLLDFVSSCDIIIHGGTPFILDFQDAETELFNPTINGTENFLEIISLTPEIEKVVFIASVAGWNTNFPFPADGKSFTDSFDENDSRFSSTNSHPYAQAKFIANQVVEKFIKENTNLSFEITTVSPVGVMGKSLSNREDSTSNGLQFLIKNKIAPDAFIQMLFDDNISFSLVDVEDVAKAIYKAATTKGLHGKDYLLATETYKISDMNLMLNQQEPKEIGQIIYKNDLAKKELGMQFRPIKETLFNY
ncbi:NAD-dependent epimerase/dehydratase family protein [Flavobacterium capsici]|uniref:NAD-dependent epimerase/dehydratase family protein n=1 Tax=Flavobacterium capsici TaxID=3075618 RepID=A0AA96F6I7_9FLAO|nr:MULTISPECIES: NAD-dependent epimerase/dehydratase family protein [unclassified Flavobacterium]WNM18670.1 NAD-dependent epimerase/dehydratase family protein [Flavobacterium sp. PMR2A8]WNM22721.1 NAD-dependent epimerase/dehydratase family protein [Flavobacterium sp. PMTSA4]